MYEFKILVKVESWRILTCGTKQYSNLKLEGKRKRSKVLTGEGKTLQPVDGSRKAVRSTMSFGFKRIPISSSTCHIHLINVHIVLKVPIYSSRKNVKTLRNTEIGECKYVTRQHGYP